jgi:hypothetical protein
MGRRRSLDLQGSIAALTPKLFSLIPWQASTYKPTPVAQTTVTSPVKRLQVRILPQRYLCVAEWQGILTVVAYSPAQLSS